MSKLEEGEAHGCIGKGSSEVPEYAIVQGHGHGATTKCEALH